MSAVIFFFSFQQNQMIFLKILLIIRLTVLRSPEIAFVMLQPHMIHLPVVLQQLP